MRSPRNRAATGPSPTSQTILAPLPPTRGPPACPDRGLRRSLLESIDQYAQHLTTAVIEDMIYPQLQTGFTDTHAYIRELTLKSMLALAPKLTNKTLVTSVLKHLSKLQVGQSGPVGLTKGLGYDGAGCWHVGCPFSWPHLCIANAHSQRLTLIECRRGAGDAGVSLCALGTRYWQVGGSIRHLISTMLPHCFFPTLHTTRDRSHALEYKYATAG